MVFTGNVATDTQFIILQMGFHQWSIGSTTIVLPHSVIDSDITEIYLNDNLQDYYLKTTAG